GLPFSHDAVILRLAGCGSIGAEVEVLAIQGDGLTGCTVLAVRRISVDETGHERTSEKVQNGKYRFAKGLRGRSARRGQVRYFNVRRDLLAMGDTGLEPVTSSVSCWRASQLRQSPESISSKL